ncbi:MAG: hypothetical protein AAFQ15_14725 [Pseudomonadota bacterium]
MVGVFLGIQIGNWNEAPVTNIQEAEYLEQLRNEIASNADMARMQSTFVDKIIEVVAEMAAADVDVLSVMVKDIVSLKAR